MAYEITNSMRGGSVIRVADPGTATITLNDLRANAYTETVTAANIRRVTWSTNGSISIVRNSVPILMLHNAGEMRFDDFGYADEKITEDHALVKLEEMTPLAQIVSDAKPKPVKKEEPQEAAGAPTGQVWKGGEPKPGPIDVEYKSKMGPTAAFKTTEGYSIKTWGRVGTDNDVLGVWGEFVSVDYDICVADGACIDACPVGVYEWADFPGNPASGKKPLMSKEPDCIFCLACEGVCPPQAIKIFEQK